MRFRLFERYTERARRCIFFARTESSIFGSKEIRSEELLLGILREDTTVAVRLGIEAVDGMRKEIEALAPPGERIPTSVDLPLSLNAKRALALAAEEAEKLGHDRIDSSHLLLGLLRVEDCLAAELLRKRGFDYAMCLAEAGRVQPRTFPAPPVVEESGALAWQARALRQLVDTFLDRAPLGENDGDKILRRKPWTRLEALGHLIDWAIAHQQWLLEAALESKVAAANYPDESAKALERYGGFSWPDAVDLWVSLNRLLVHFLERVPQDQANVPCRIGIAAPVPLAKLVENYIEHCQDIAGQILAHL
jgi:hypothetical protein